VSADPQLLDQNVRAASKITRYPPPPCQKGVALNHHTAVSISVPLTLGFGASLTRIHINTGKTGLSGPVVRHCGSLAYLEIRSCDRLVPIWLKVVTIWLAEVSRKKLAGFEAQFCSKVEVGSPPVFTWMV
jgi:hypothetical protein